MRYMDFTNVCHHYFTNMYDPRQWIIPRVPGFKLTKVWDYDLGIARRFSQVFYDKPEVCHTLERATEDVDAVFIADCHLDGSDHLKLATPFLKKGIPTFVDKPFATTLADARAMIELSKKYAVPLMSASLLSYVREPKLLRQRFGELEGPVRQGIIKGYNGWRTKRGLEGIIHGISLALAVFGPGVEWVEAMGTLPVEYLLLHWPNGMEALVINHSGECGTGSFHCEVHGEKSPRNPPNRTVIEMQPVGDPEFIYAGQQVLKIFRQMIHTRKMPVPYESMLEPIAIYENATRAQKTGKRVYVDVKRQ